MAHWWLPLSLCAVTTIWEQLGAVHGERGMNPEDTTTDWNLSGLAVLRRMADALDAGTPAAVATVVAVEGNAYRRPGAKMLLTEDGTAGSVTAGCLESDVADIAAEVRTSGQFRLERFDLTDDEQWGLGLGCNGVIDLLIEPLDDRFAPLLNGYHDSNDGLAVTVIESDSPEYQPANGHTRQPVTSGGSKGSRTGFVRPSASKQR